MADVFLRLVKSTAKFNKERFGKDIQRCEPKKNNEDILGGTSTVRRDTQSKVKPSLLYSTAQALNANITSNILENGKSNQNTLSSFQHGTQNKLEHSAESNDEQSDEDDEDEITDEEESNDDSDVDIDSDIDLMDENNDLDLGSKLRKVKLLRRKHDISVRGPYPPPPAFKWTQMQQRYRWDDRLMNCILRNPPEGCGYDEPSSIQMQMIPIVMESRHAIACAPTGSGKTAAFAIPIISSLTSNLSISTLPTAGTIDSASPTLSTKTNNHPSSKSSLRKLRAIVLSPTRELNVQTLHVFQKLCRNSDVQLVHLNALSSKQEVAFLESMLLSNSNSTSKSTSTKSSETVNISNHTKKNKKSDKNQATRDTQSEQSLNEVPVIIIATPTRLLESVEKGLKLHDIRFVVADEADRLLTEEFGAQIRTLLEKITTNTSINEPKRKTSTKKPKKIKKAVILDSKAEFHSSVCITAYSATMAQRVFAEWRALLTNPLLVRIGVRNAGVPVEHVRQELVYVGNESGKLMYVRSLLNSGTPLPMLIFVQSKSRARSLTAELQYERVKVGVVESGMSVRARVDAVEAFRSGSIWVLICTDVLARGIDFRAVRTVLQYDFPQSTDHYVHRIGRAHRRHATESSSSTTSNTATPTVALTLFTDTDTPLLGAIARVISFSGGEVPSWMLKLSSRPGALLKQLKNHPVARAPIGSTTVSKKSISKIHSRKRKFVQHHQPQSEKKIKFYDGDDFQD